MRKKADRLHQPPTPPFVATFEVEANPAGFGQLEKILNAYRQVYNATLSELVRRLNRARKFPEWEAARNLPKGSPERKAAVAEVRKQYGLGEVQIYDLFNQFQLTRPHAHFTPTWRRHRRYIYRFCFA